MEQLLENYVKVNRKKGYQRYQMCVYYHHPVFDAEVQFNSYSYRREPFRKPWKIVQSMLIICHTKMYLGKLLEALYLITSWAVFIRYYPLLVYNLPVSENFLAINPLNHFNNLWVKAVLVRYINSLTGFNINVWAVQSQTKCHY